MKFLDGSDTAKPVLRTPAQRAAVEAAFVRLDGEAVVVEQRIELEREELAVRETTPWFASRPPEAGS